MQNMSNNNKNIMAFVNCLQPNCRVSKCPHSKDKASISKKLEIWCKENYVHGKIVNYGAIVIEKLALTTADIGKIYLTEQTYDGHSCNNLFSDQQNQPITENLQNDTSQSEDVVTHRQLFYADTLFASEEINPEEED